MPDHKNQKIPLVLQPPIIYLLGCNLAGAIFGFIWYATETYIEGFHFFGDAMITCRSFIVVFSVSSLMCLIVTLLLRKTLRRLEFRKKGFYYLILSGVLIGTCVVCLTLSDVMGKTYDFVSLLRMAAKSEDFSIKIIYEGQDGTPIVIPFCNDSIASAKESLSKAIPYEPSHDQVGISFFTPEEGTLEISWSDRNPEVFDWHIPYKFPSSIVLESHEGRYAIVQNVFFEVQKF